MLLLPALSLRSIMLLLSFVRGQSIVSTTTTTTITQLVECVTTIFTTTTLDYCPCSATFPSITMCVECRTCATTTISPLPSGEQFSITLTIPLQSGDQVITLSRVGNTVGIGGSDLIFNLSSDGIIRDVDTGDIVYVILPSGAKRKRFSGAVDLLIGTPPAAGTYQTWSRTLEGELVFNVISSSGNSITLGFGVAIADDGSIDTTLPIQMYDLSAGQPSNIEDGSASPSFISGTSTSTSSTSTSTITSSTTSGHTYTVTQYGSRTGVSTSTQSNGIVYVVTTLLQSTTTLTLYASTTSISTVPFNSYSPTITVYYILSQYITTSVFYGPSGYTSTPIIGSVFPTLTAFEQISQVTITNTTYGPNFSTLFAQTNISIPTVTYWIQFTPESFITTTKYIYDQYPDITTTLYFTTPTAIVSILRNQYVVFTTQTGTADLTTTFGPDNPTATVSVMISPTTTVTLQSVTMVWNLETTSFETISQTPGYTRTVRMYIPYPPASYVRFQPTDATGAAQFFTAESTILDPQPTQTVWFISTGPNTKCKFIQVNDNLILATDPDTGNKLAVPYYPWAYFPLSPSGSPLYFSNRTQFNQINGALDIPFNYVNTGSNLLKLNASFSSSYLSPTPTASGANFFYEPSQPGPYTPFFYKSSDAVQLFGGRSPIGTTEMSFTSSAPTAR
ncbi:hypothetical protein H072_2623 [Dactylellina haptotyla CBS 200.50]|uniref:Uncharacterized protein n=1 Tax=Dactylellina haptotyla (strain CBS 200.50) TaxID=1284197 RepID=S8AKG5_DACHA|nr:hypothetical protein H072_2623 [Dactylellina haptotyla CBS 200.50]